MKVIVSRQQVIFIKLKSLEVLNVYLFIGKVFDIFISIRRINQILIVIVRHKWKTS